MLYPRIVYPAHVRSLARFKRMNRDIENLKEEITSKDQQLVKEHFDSKKVRPDR